MFLFKYHTRQKRRRCRWTGVGLTRGERQRGNQPNKRHERSTMRGIGVIRDGGVLVDGRRWRDERQHDNQPDEIDKRGRWQ